METAPLANGSVVYNLKTGKFIMLNRSANRIWNALTRPLALQDLVDTLLACYPGLNAPLAGRAVSEALVELQRFELVGERRDDSGNDGAKFSPAQEPADDDYAPPSVKVLDEEDLLKVFQITAAEISVASCWWGACSVGCP
jgi:hypothetical protein